VLHQPYSFHTSRNTSEIITGVGKAESVVNGVLLPTLDLFVATMQALAIIVGLLVIDWVTAVFAGALFVLVYWLIAGLSSGRLARNSRVISASATERVQGMQEGLGGIRDVLLDGSQYLHLSRFQSADHAFRRALVQNTVWGQAPRHLVEALGIAIIAGLSVSTALRSGGMGDALPVLGALALGAQKLLPLLQRIYSGWTSVVGNRGNLEDVAQLANAPMPEEAEVAGDSSRLPFANGLTLAGVGFRYRTDLPWVVRNLDLEIPRGARVGFAGETGCGKSTLLDLIMGLLSPSEGKLVVDGVPITVENRRHWQARIAHVPQSIYLADATLKANIAFGVSPECIDIGRVKEAAQRARIHEFVQTLDDGYETKVGERGVRLSGGQRQRVGVARALYRKADVLILDEATSALDGDTEASVMDGIAELGPQTTVLIVAHRLSTLGGCDFVVRMASGGLVERLSPLSTTPNKY
jgi:ABC-type multidrug transport system fused ATPase/permease subunit